MKEIKVLNKNYSYVKEDNKWYTQDSYCNYTEITNKDKINVLDSYIDISSYIDENGETQYEECIIDIALDDKDMNILRKE